jgi:ABC-type amino acid transport substrate-binding protein
MSQAKRPPLPLVLLFCLCLFFCSVPLQAEEQTGNLEKFPPDIQRIKDRGTLIVAMYYKDVKPFMFHDADGNFIGHEVELAKKIGKELGVEVVFDRSPKTFDAIINLVAEEKADMAISLISRTLSRARKVRFSDPYIVLKPMLLMNRLTVARHGIDPNKPGEALYTFKGKIGEKEGTSYKSLAGKMAPLATVVSFPEWIDTMNSVLNRETDAALRDEIGVKNYLAASPEQAINLQIIPLKDPRYADPLAIAVPAASLQLQEWLNLYFTVNGTTGTADALLEQYRQYYE